MPVAYRETQNYTEWYNPTDGRSILRINQNGVVSLGQGVTVDQPNVGGGTDFYVDPDNGNDSNSGENWQSAVATITAALALCTSGAGDRIFILPGTYEENLSVSEKDYVHLIGVQTGYGRPDVVNTSAAPALTVDRSQGFRATGIRFANDGFDSDVVRQEGNGFRYEDCVFDGEATMGVTKGLVRLWCDAADDSYTASEGAFVDCLFRGSPGKGLIFDCQNAAVGVLPTDDVFVNCRFADNTAEDVFLAATAVSVADVKRCVFDHCFFGLGGKNKATHIDIQTNKIGTANTSMFTDCFINDDTVDTTAIKAAGTGASFVGCRSLDGLIDGDALD